VRVVELAVAVGGDGCNGELDAQRALAGGGVVWEGRMGEVRDPV
jgi:hypothetical protein